MRLSLWWDYQGSGSFANELYLIEPIPTAGTAKKSIERIRFQAVREALDKLIGPGSHFVAEDLYCITGLEATWNVNAHHEGQNRYGLFQWNEANWNAWNDLRPVNQQVKWSQENATDIATSGALAVFSLEVRVQAYLNKSGTLEEARIKAFNGYGENDGIYGQAIAACSKAWKERGFDAGFAVIQSYANWVSGGRKGPAPTF